MNVKAGALSGACLIFGVWLEVTNKAFTQGMKAIVKARMTAIEQGLKQFFRKNTKNLVNGNFCNHFGKEDPEVSISFLLTVASEVMILARSEAFTLCKVEVLVKLRDNVLSACRTEGGL